jgi:cytidylate kinase
MNTDNNKLIAEFLGWEIENEMYINTNKVFVQYTYQSLKFNSDWNWIMQVRKKIEDLGFDVNIFKNGIEIVNYSNKTEIVNNVSQISYNESIDFVYSGFVEFVEWFNKQAK